MTDNVTTFPHPEDMVAKMRGPQSSDHQVIIEGRAIPGLTMRELSDRVLLTLDGRFCISVPRERAVQIAWFVATALAIGAGYSHIGAESQDRPFAPQVSPWGEE